VLWAQAEWLAPSARAVTKSVVATECRFFIVCPLGEFNGDAQAQGFLYMDAKRCMRPL
jgi:hypothetical protein